MKTIKNFINEELILEFIISFLDDFKISIDLLIPHGEERQIRDGKGFIPKNEIVYSIGKVAKDIREDFDLNNIKYKDRIKILDKSREKHLNIIADINKDSKKNNWIKLTVVTEKENNMPTHDIKKIYTTYSSDNKVKNDIKLLKNML